MNTLPEDLLNKLPCKAETLPKETIKQTALSALLHQRKKFDSSILISLEINGMILGEGGFMLAAFQPAAEELPASLTYLDCLASAKAVIEAVFAEQCVHYSFLMDGYAIVLCCFPRLLVRDHREAQIRDLVTRLRVRTCQLYEDAMGIPLRSTISFLGYGANQIAELYFHLVETMEFAEYLGKLTHIQTDPLEIRSRGILRRTEMIESVAHRFANQIYTKTMTSVPNQVNRFVRSLTDSENVSLRDLHFSLLLFDKCFLQDLLGLDVIDGAYIQKTDTLGQLYAAANVQKLIDAMVAVITDVQTYYNKREDMQATALLERARTDIEAHFTDPGFSVSALAERLEVNQATLSNLYRTFYNETIVATLRRMRVSEAKKLLQDDAYSLEQVCALSGFGSINTMYRAFRDTEGIAPGKFRKK